MFVQNTFPMLLQLILTGVLAPYGEMLQIILLAITPFGPTLSCHLQAAKCTIHHPVGLAATSIYILKGSHMIFISAI